MFQQPRVVAVLVFGAGLLIYIPTLAPGLLWGGGDFATFQTRLYTGEIIFESVFGHPLWVVVSRPFAWLPFGDIAYRANLAAAIYASGALAFTYLSAQLLTCSMPAALLATGALAVSHTFWTYAVMPKVYSLNALLLTVVIYLLLRWRRSQQSIYLYLSCFLYGLSLFNHLVMATAIAGCAAYVIMVTFYEHRIPLRSRHLIISAALLIINLLSYTALSLSRTQSTHTGEVIVAFLLGFVHVLTRPATLLSALGIGIALLIYQFPLTCLAGIVGLKHVWHNERLEAILLSLIVLGDIAFLLGAADPRTGGEYVWNLHYYLQVYVVFALWIALGMAARWEWLWNAPIRRIGLIFGTVVLPVIMYAVTPVLARTFIATIPGFRALPGRDNLSYVLSPWKHTETGPREFINSILLVLPPNSVIYADYSIKSMLDYVQIVEHTRLDVRVYLIPDGDASYQVSEILSHRDEPNLFIADLNRYYPVEALQEHFDIIPYGPIYRLMPR